MTFFEYQTSHPNILGIEQEALRRYIDSNNVWDEMRLELEALSDLCARELQARRDGLDSPL